MASSGSLRGDRPAIAARQPIPLVARIAEAALVDEIAGAPREAIGIRDPLPCPRCNNR